MISKGEERRRQSEQKPSRNKSGGRGRGALVVVVAATVLMMLIPFFRAPTSRPRFSPQHSASDAHVRLPFEHLGVDGFRVLAREGHG